MTQILLISATPTKWDEEGRIGGTHSLPLTDSGVAAITALVENIPHAVASIYTFRRNQACDQAARIVARRFTLRIRDTAALEPLSLGLWQGLTRDELRFRFPKVFPLWEDNALAVNPPEGEEFAHAVARFKEGVRKIVRRNRGHTAALVVRPLSLRIIAGLLRGEPPESIATHLQERSPMETIEQADE